MDKRLTALLDTVGIYAVAILLLILGAFVSPEFLTAANLMSVLASVSLLGMVAAGMAFITYSGNMADLSVPATMAFSEILNGNARDLLKMVRSVAITSIFPVSMDGFSVPLARSITRPETLMQNSFLRVDANPQISLEANSGPKTI